MIYNKQTVEMCENIAKFYEEKTGYKFIKMGFDVSDNSMILFFDLKRDPSTTRFLQPGSLKEIPDKKDRTEFIKLHGIFLQDVMIRIS